MSTYEWIELVEDLLSGLWNVSLVVFGGVIVLIFGPRIRTWYRAYEQKEAEKQKKVIEELERLIADTDSQLANEGQPKDRGLRFVTAAFRFVLANLKAVQVTAGLVSLAIAVVVGVGVFWLLDKAYEPARARLLQEGHEVTMQAARNHVESVDKNRELLYLRTLEQIEKPEPPGEGHTRGEHAQFLEDALEWRGEQRAISMREELCRYRAHAAGENNSGNDWRRIWVTSLSYRECMLEEGWFVELCSPQEDGCKELTYFETPCTITVRLWLENGGDPFEVKRCLFPSLDERLEAEGY